MPRHQKSQPVLERVNRLPNNTNRPRYVVEYTYPRPIPNQASSSPISSRLALHRRGSVGDAARYPRHSIGYPTSASPTSPQGLWEQHAPNTSKSSHVRCANEDHPGSDRRDSDTSNEVGDVSRLSNSSHTWDAVITPLHAASFPTGTDRGQDLGSATPLEAHVESQPCQGFVCPFYEHDPELHRGCSRYCSEFQQDKIRWLKRHLEKHNDVQDNENIKDAIKLATVQGSDVDGRKQKWQNEQKPEKTAQLEVVYRVVREKLFGTSKQAVIRRCRHGHAHNVRREGSTADGAGTRTSQRSSREKRRRSEPQGSPSVSPPTQPGESGPIRRSVATANKDHLKTRLNRYIADLRRLHNLVPENFEYRRVLGCIMDYSEPRVRRALEQPTSEAVYRMDRPLYSQSASMSFTQSHRGSVYPTNDNLPPVPGDATEDTLDGPDWRAFGHFGPQQWPNPTSYSISGTDVSTSWGLNDHWPSSQHHIATGQQSAYSGLEPSHSSVMESYSESIPSTMAQASFRPLPQRNHSELSPSIQFCFPQARASDPNDDLQGL